ncbi:GNAT family N-acetyltransferase [Eudoraea sp.]|uniref:GNAT family N-acetyltransferase n=1 Tax=Eudoraea sp. TaxID=1979955 RepID=UPI003C758E3C
MGLFKLHRVMLLTELHLKSDILKECCDSITLDDKDDYAWQSEKEVVRKNIDENLYVIKNVPRYLNITFFDYKNLKTQVFPSITGFAISLGNYNDIDSYMRDQFKSKARSQLLRRVKRLEKCYDITYKRYYGKIDRDDCLALLAILKGMIITRFKERNQVSDSLKNWLEIETSLHSLINDKKASLFVIYNEGVPISISICYHYGNVFFSYIDSYDVNYFKFGLGNIMIYKKLEICFENNYKFLDMGWGELDYKRRWCNYIYNYEHHILLPNNSLPAYLIALWEGNKTRLNVYLKSSKVSLMFKKAKSAFKTETNHDENTINYSLENHENLASLSNISPIDLNDEKNFYFKTIINDFIYTTEEYYLDVKLYNLPKKGFYVIRGKNNCKKIVFQE